MHAPSRVSDTALAKVLACIGAVPALAGVVAAAAAVGLSTTPAGISRVDRAAPVIPARQNRQVRAVVLDHTGGDLKRAVRVTRRSSSSRSAQGLSWAGVALIIPQQVTPITANVA